MTDPWLTHEDAVHVADRCERCGTAAAEVAWSHAATATVCKSCLPAPGPRRLTTGPVVQHDKRDRENVLDNRNRDDNRSPSQHPVPVPAPVGPSRPPVVGLGGLPPVGERATCADGGYVLVTVDMHRVRDDMEAVWERRLDRDEQRPFPYATTFCARRCELRDPSHASRVIRALVRLGVVEHAGSLPPRGKRDGTKTYAPPGWRDGS